MSEQQTETTIPPHRNAPVSFPPGHPLYAPELSQEQQESYLDRFQRQMREDAEAERRRNAAWQSPEVAKIRDIVREDGNVEWLDFVKHVGGILKVAEMADEYGLPDTDRIIPSVDALFAEQVEREMAGGCFYRRLPSGRPYVAGRGTSAGEAKAAAKRAARNQDPGEHDAEALLRQEQEAQARPSGLRAR